MSPQLQTNKVEVVPSGNGVSSFGKALLSIAAGIAIPVGVIVFQDSQIAIKLTEQCARQPECVNFVANPANLTPIIQALGGILAGGFTLKGVVQAGKMIFGSHNG